MVDKPHDECGVIAVYAPQEQASTIAYFGLFALQHRGQEAAGIAVADGRTIHEHKNLGLVSQVFNQALLKELPGHLAIGHTRYSTTGSSTLRNVQPFLIDTQHGAVAVAHNGNLVNAPSLRQLLLKRGVGLSSTSDSAILTMMLAGAEGDDWLTRIKNTMPLWQGAYSLVILVNDQVFAVRDPWGFRPLSFGKLQQGGYVVASETCALQTVGCEEIREVLPGEIVTLNQQGLVTVQGMVPMSKLARCTFEHIYFSRPDSDWDKLSIHHVRQRLGAELWGEAPIDADLVVPVPDSSIPAAIGFARAANISYNDGLIKNRYIGRTFIEPTDSLRKQGVALKFNALSENLRDKRIIVIDDSIVRGNTSGPLVKMLRKAGAREVHLRITCPPIAHPCFMGVDMGTYDELIAHKMSVDEIKDHIGCDSLHFLSLDGMMRAIGKPQGYCNACFTGKYPIEIDTSHTKTGFE
jgi:amidophosphoribosyltransferase